MALVAALAACTSAPAPSETPPPVGTTAASPSPTSTVPASPFPVREFAAITENPVGERSAAEFQAALEDLANGASFGKGGGRRR